MGEVTGVQWCHHTFNGWIGCDKVSPGCKNCYAEVDTYARVSRSRGLELWGPKAARHVTSDANWRKPYAWARAAREAGERRRVFSASLSDVFERRRDLDVHRTRLWNLVDDTPELDWLLLTKRPENIEAMVPARWREHGARNVWIGTTAENQPELDRRAPYLRRIYWAARRFLSLEPLLGPVDVAAHLHPRHGAPIDWAIFGGESGSGARACAEEWLEEGVAQAVAAGTRPFVKQLGANLTSVHRIAPPDSFMRLEDVRAEHLVPSPPAGQEGWVWAWRARFKGDPKGSKPEHLPEWALRLFPGDPFPPAVPPAPEGEECPF